jgi:hypothetical protein
LGVIFLPANNSSSPIFPINSFTTIAGIGKIVGLFKVIPRVLVNSLFVTGLGDVPLIAPFKLSWFMQYKIIPVKSSI